MADQLSLGDALLSTAPVADHLELIHRLVGPSRLRDGLGERGVQRGV